MTKQYVSIPPRKILLISSGIYDDYSISGIYRTLKEIHPDKIMKEWLDTHPEQQQRHYFKSREAIAHLLTNKFLAELPHFEWHTDDYGTPDEGWSK